MAVRRNLSFLFALMMVVVTMYPFSTAGQESTPAGGPVEIGLEPVAEGFAEPIGLVDAYDDSGRLFVIEKGGTIRIIADSERVDTPFLDITDRVGSSGYEQGLLGLAFAPNYADSGLFYVNYTDADGNTVVSRFSVSDDSNVADAESERVILQQEQPYQNHNGGHIAFGPDNYLYIGLGDGGSGGDPEGNGQDLTTWLGKMLRIEVDPDYVPEGEAYGIPEDNPFLDEEGALPEIYAYGLRNPWMFTFDRETGDLTIADVGQDQIEEINIVTMDESATGLNYGWNTMEGTACYLEDGCDTTGLVLPVIEYTHDVGGCSVTGGFIYRGESIPELQGNYLYADFCSGLMWQGMADSSGAWTSSDPIETSLQIAAFGEDANGEVYVTDMRDGAIYVIAAGL